MKWLLFFPAHIYNMEGKSSIQRGRFFTITCRVMMSDSEFENFQSNIGKFAVNANQMILFLKNVLENFELKKTL